MKRPVPSVALACLSMFISGCAPYPHRVVRVPEIRGMLVDVGVPIADAAVLIDQNRDDPCGNPSLQGRTNAKGEFVISGKTETRFFHSFLNPPGTVGQLTSLCFQVADEPRIFKGRVMHRTAGPVVVSVSCDRALPRCEVVRCEGNCRGVSVQP